MFVCESFIGLAFYLYLKKRTTLIELMLKDKFHPSLFDLSFNCSTLSKEEIMGTIISMMEAKKMI